MTGLANFSLTTQVALRAVKWFPIGSFPPLGEGGMGVRVLATVAEKMAPELPPPLPSPGRGGSKSHASQPESNIS
jgi:hypothetical protein